MTPQTTHPIVLGTAGHIDHGKTSLVKALTGIDTDRLKVEKERGITTELGFAHMEVAGRRLSVVDVPGHEKFIRSMTAGATGIDLVCLIVAADEGVMPQTREHVAICQLLGVQHGLIVVTKADLVDADGLEIACLDIREQLAETFLAGAPLFEVSSTTGQGIDALRSAIAEQAQTMMPRETGRPFRLPIDRVFSVRGFGTIVTGTISSGTLNVGENVVCLPQRSVRKVRGIEIHGAAANTAVAGMRCAVNLGGVAANEIARGDLLAHPDQLAASHAIDVKLSYLRTSHGPLKQRARLLLHHATRQYHATLTFADIDELEPGNQAFAQLRVNATIPLFAFPGDRFIVRGFAQQEHYGTTVGGGEIIRIDAPKLRRRGRRGGIRLDELFEATPAQRIAIEVRESRLEGVTVAQLQTKLGLAGESLEELVTSLQREKVLIQLDRPQGPAIYVHQAPWQSASETIVAAVTNPSALATGLLRQQVRGRLGRVVSGPVFDQLLASLVQAQKVTLAGDRIVSFGGDHGPTELEIALTEKFRQWALTPPRPKQFAELLGAPESKAKQAVSALASRGQIERIKADYYVDAEALSQLQGKLLSHLETHGQLTTKEWKEITGTSRKYSIPLAEYFDEKKITLRVGEIRARRQ